MSNEANDGMEVRGGIPAEIRMDDDGIKISGYAAIFNEVADIGGWFREQIMPGAFDNVLNDDVVFLINHDGLPLARTRSKTMTLTQDEKGLRMETVLDPDDPDVQSIVGKMKRGDLDKMSFAFAIGIQEWDDTVEPPMRTITKFDSLYDVSIVTSPAYDGTDIGLRSLEKHRDKNQKAQNFRAARSRRMKMTLALQSAQENGDT